MADLYFGWHSLGRDMNGSSLLAERKSWLAQDAWSEPGHHEAGLLLFMVLEGESSKITAELMPKK